MKKDGVDVKRLCRQEVASLALCASQLLGGQDGAEVGCSIAGLGVSQRPFVHRHHLGDTTLF